MPKVGGILPYSVVEINKKAYVIISNNKTLVKVMELSEESKVFPLNILPSFDKFCLDKYIN